MSVFTVAKAEPNTEREFQVYTALLEEIGVDVTNVPRIPEPGTTNRWLYVWRNRVQAERFARELGTRLRDPSWAVREFDVSEEERGPLAPLIILSISRSDGTEFRLDPSSQARIINHFPNARLAGRTHFPVDVRRDFERQHGPVWDQVITILTGIPSEAIERLGGVRILNSDGAVLFERLP